MNENFKNIIAKNDGTTLVEHSISVMKYAYEYATEIGIDKISSNEEPLLSILLYSAIMHDIMKADEMWQKNLMVNDKKKKQLIPHSAVSAFYIIRKLGIGSWWKELIRDCILFTHPVSMKDIATINVNTLKNIKNIDIIDELYDYLYNVYEKFCKEHHISTYPIKRNIIGQKPNLLGTEKNPINYYVFTNGNDSKIERNVNFMIINSILKSADISASNGKKVNLYRASINPLVNYVLPSNYDVRIFNEQNNMSNRMTHKLDVLDAVTGFGKTLTSLLYILKNKEKAYVIVPNNIIAYNYYYEIVGELQKGGISDSVSVALLLGSKYIYGNDESDIIITNIDNAFNPNIKTSCNIRSLDLLKRTIVFDEFHNYTCSVAMMSAFITINRMRKKLGTGRILLMSATPEDYYYTRGFYTLSDDVMIHKPSYNKYANKKFRFHFIKGDIKESYKGKDCLVMCNMPRNVQELYANGVAENCFHSYFMESDKDRRRNILVRTKGKECPEHNEESWACTNILSTGIDISFSSLCVKNITPELFLQILGRILRWSEDGTADVYIHYCPEDVRDINFLRRCCFSVAPELVEEWFEYCFDKIGENGVVTQEQMYRLYNEFKNLDDIKELYEAKIDECLGNSDDEFSNLYYTRSKNVDKDDCYEHISTVPNLRSRSDGTCSAYIRFKDKDGNWIPEPLVVMNYVVDFPEMLNKPVYLRQIVNDIATCDNPKDYGTNGKLSKMKDKIDKDGTQVLGKYLYILSLCSKTPLLVSSVGTYDYDAGLLM